jgi:RimJ/RimL family protein N-acetyltransferase
VIDTRRLRLETLTYPVARAIVAGDRDGQPWHPEFPRQDDRDAASMVSADGEAGFGTCLIVEKTSGLVVGTIGFTGPPDETGTVSVGYGLVEPARGRGYATEALRGLVTSVRTSPAFAQVRVITADALPDNVASHRVLEKAGFVRTEATEEAVWYALSRVESGVERSAGDE